MTMTPSQRRRRNLDLARARAAGLGVRALARLARLSHTQVRRILAELEAEHDDRASRVEIASTARRLGG